MEENKVKLTPEQVENWRNTLFNYFGPYALVMPVEQIEAFREKLQNDIRTLWPEGRSRKGNIRGKHVRDNEKRICYHL